jgi:hypothetical protein
MSYIITPFEVSSQALAEPVKVKFVHLFAAIATRHSDTIDCVFRVGEQEIHGERVEGPRAVVSISCPALSKLRDVEHRYLYDQQLAEIAALHLRRTLEQGYDATEAVLFIDEPMLRKLGKELGYL